MAQENVSKPFMFLEFCQICEKISTSSKVKKGELLGKFVSSFRLEKGGKEFYPVLRLLLPQLDKDRGAYGLKEHALAQRYIRALSLPKEGHDAHKLLNFRAPKSAGNSAGDFGEVVYWIVRNRHSGTGSGKLTVDNVNAHLDKLADKHAEHNPRSFDEELLVMMQHMTPLEIKWLTRLLLKEMRLGMGHKKILYTYHPDGVDLFDVSNNLFKICEKLSDPGKRLHEVEVAMFDPFRPMLAERCDVQKVEKELAGAPFHYIETKWDGERCQLHFQEGNFKYFSRNGFEYTDSFGANNCSGSFSPRFSKQLKPNIQSFIMDGEMMGWNARLKSFGTKGMNLDVKSLQLGSTHQPCFCAFDILLLNGNVVTNKPLKERLDMLATVFTPLEGVAVITKSIKVINRSQVMKALNDAIDYREEGIVLKHPESVYKPNVRKGGWYKIKPEYTDGAMTDLDMLIIGGYHGEGRRRGVVSHFLLGIAVPAQEPGEDPKEFHAVGRVGSGCTMGELAELSVKLADHWQKCKSKATLPPGLVWTKEKPDLWIEPSKSCILQVKASEVIYSDAYPVNYTLRFPRIEKVRYDKRWQDCLTTKEFNELRVTASGKLCSTHIIANRESPTKAKRPRLTQSVPTVGHAFLNSDLGNVKQVTKLFEGKEICVFSGNEEYSKKDLETKVVENGGKVSQNPGSKTHFIVCGNEKNVRVKSVMAAGKHDVITVDWFLRCVNSEFTPTYRPNDLICASSDTKELMALLYDEYADSYTEDATMESLKESLNIVKERENCKLVTNNEMLETDDILFNGPSPYAIFRQCSAYFFKFQVGDLASNLKCPLKTAASMFMFMGGKISGEVQENTTHIVLHTSDVEYLEEVRCESSLSKPLFIVSQHWVLDSWKKRTCLDEHLFLYD